MRASDRERLRARSSLESTDLSIQVIEANKILFSFELCFCYFQQKQLWLVNSLTLSKRCLLSRYLRTMMHELFKLFLFIYYILAVIITWANKFHKYKLNV